LFLFFTFSHLFILCFFYFFLCSLWYIRTLYTHKNTILLFTLPPLALVLRSDAVAAAVAVFRVPPVAADHVKFNLFLFVYPSVLTLIIIKKNLVPFCHFLLLLLFFHPLITTHHPLLGQRHSYLLFFKLFFPFYWKNKQLNSTNPLQIHI
jgi:hypothetical protein